MVSEFHETLVGLIGRAQKVEKKLAAVEQPENENRINRLEELRNKWLQAEEVMRSSDYENGCSNIDFSSIIRQLVSDLEREIEECESRCNAEREDVR